MKTIYSLLFIVLLAYSCKVTEYPARGNFAAKTVVNVQGDYSPKEKKYLEDKLALQIDDSLLVTRVSKITKGGLGFIKHRVKVYHNFDSNSISKTIDLFKAAYVANGYFRGGQTTYRIDSMPGKDSNAKLITFNAFPARNHIMDSINYEIYDSAVRKIVAQSWKESYLKKNDLYAQDLLDAELRRIVYNLKNNGYLFMVRDDFKVVADTINTALFKLSDDPFEDQKFLLDAAEFAKNPNTDITIKLKDKIDSNKLKQYIVRKIIVDVDNFDKDLVPTEKKILQNGNIVKRYFNDRFRDSFITQHIFLKHGNIYKESDFEKTFQTLNSFNVWQQIAIDTIGLSDTKSDSIDFIIRMQPFNQFSSERKIEGTYNSQNNTNLTASTAKVLLGFNLYQNFKNRNFQKRGVQSNLTFNSSVDFGKPSPSASSQNIINTLQGGVNFNLLYPEFQIFKSLNKKRNFIQPRSVLNGNLSYSSRLNFFRLFEASAAYTGSVQVVLPKNVYNVQLSLLNVDYKVLSKSTALNNLLAINPAFRNIYRDGLILSAQGVVNKSNTVENKALKTSVQRNQTLSIELPWSFLVESNDLLNFVKFDYSYRQFWNRPRNKTYAMRLAVGLGYGFTKLGGGNTTMPFFRQFSGGGPSSLRAWNIRGVSSYSTRKSLDSINENFGDIYAEFNFEHRHKIKDIYGIPIFGALFADAGNIWNYKPTDPSVFPTNKSRVERIADDVAIAVGYGVRIDFGFFLIRFDLATKFKDPETLLGTGGFLRKENYDKLSDIKFQLGINMPFN